MVTWERCSIQTIIEFWSFIGSRAGCSTNSFSGLVKIIYDGTFRHSVFSTKYNNNAINIGVIEHKECFISYHIFRDKILVTFFILRMNLLPTSQHDQWKGKHIICMHTLITSVIHRETGLLTKCHEQRFLSHCVNLNVGPPSERYSDPQFEALTWIFIFNELSS